MAAPSAPLPLLDAHDGWLEVILISASGRDVRVPRVLAQQLTSIHVTTVQCSLGRLERYSSSPPTATPDDLGRLDGDGRIRLHAKVQSGDVLVGVRRPRHAATMSPEELQRAVVTNSEDDRDHSLRCPLGVSGIVTAVEGDAQRVKVTIREERPLAVGDLLHVEAGPAAVVGVIADDGHGAALLWPGLEGRRRVGKVSTAAEALAARSVGAYSLVTQQPVGSDLVARGEKVQVRALNALLNRGASVVVHEMLTVKSDDVVGRRRLAESILRGKPECHAGTPAGTDVLQAELHALGFGVDFGAAQPSLSLLTTSAIREVAPREVKKPETLNYRTLLPEQGGLFCTDVFGELDSGERRTRLGRIELPVPVVPPWSRGAVATALGWSPEELERRLAGTEEPAVEGAEIGPVGPTLRQALKALDVAALSEGSDPRAMLFRRLTAAGLTPADLLVEAWPVLPPDLRPLVPLAGGRFATSDLNDHYRRFINRSNRLHRLVELGAPGIILVNESRMLQQALDAAVQNGAWARPVLGPEERTLVSLAQLVGGPKGRFAFLCSGKRVDYSGSARVVERSDLPPQQVRVPREMAFVLFAPMIQAALEGDAPSLSTGRGAGRSRAGRVGPEDSEAWSELTRVAVGYPVILLPAMDSDAVLSLDLQLWDEPAVALAPSAITALGLTPGDAVSVHVPLDPLAVEESRTRLRGMVSLEQAKTDDGWLSRAAEAPLSSLGAMLFEAALDRQRDPATSRVARLVLGRLP